MPHTPTGPSRRGNAPKRILLAVAIAAVGVGVLVYVFAQGSGGPKQGPQGQGLPPVGAQPGVQLGGGDQVASNVDISFVARDDPTRTQARMVAQQMAPDGPRGYIATSPRMAIFQSSGQTVHVQANRGDLAMPARNQPPERGTLTGDVLIRIYEAGIDAIDPDNPGPDPATTFATPALDFNVELGTVSTRETVRGTAQNLVFEVNGLDIRGNQATSQLERLESQRGGTATYTPPATKPSDPAPQQPADQPTPRPAATPRANPPAEAGIPPAPEVPAEQPVEQFYHLQIQDNVTIVRGAMTTTADTLDAWVHLVDNALPEGAIAPLGPRTASGQLDLTARLMSALVAAVEQDRPAETSTGEPITLTWDGPLVARPLADRPRELASDDLAFRLSSPERGLVQVADADLGAKGHAATIDYYPTTQRAILLGPAANSVFVTAPGVGEARGIRVELDLLSETAALIGPGQLTALGEDRQGRIAWAERADMDFRRVPATGDQRETLTLESANFKGKVDGQTQDARLAGETVDAEFFDVDAARPLIKRLVLAREPNEPATASSDRTGSLSGDLIEVEFELDEARQGSLPDRLVATGNVQGRGREATFNADALDAKLSATLDGTKMRTEVDEALLTGSVDLAATDSNNARVTATGERVLIKPQEQFVEIVAADGAIATASRAGTRISGPQIRLDALKGQAQVFGPGTLVHELHREDRPRPSTLTLGWDNFMLFDDTKGEAEADGNATVNLTDNRTEEDRIAAANIQLAFSVPAEVDEALPTDPDFAQGERELLWARAEADPAPGSVVIIESRRYQGASLQDRTLQSALVLMVPEAKLDGPTSNIEATGQGRAIILERPEATPLDDGAVADRARGTFTDMARSGSNQALVDWLGTMTFDRMAQELVLNRAVRLSHRADADSPQLDLDCETLTITLAGLDRSRSATTLRSARAQGAVYAATDERELVCRSLDYDATTGIVIASGDAMAPVVVFDKRSAQPASAASVRWNINTGEFTIVRPLPAGGAIPAGGP
jgi:lipopolysaccharide export system protein LptA